MRENRIMKFNYDDTDKKIEVDIYGLIFEINKEKIVEKNTELLESKDEEIIEKEIKALIGEDAIDKLNAKRKEDGYGKMTIDVEIAVLTCLFKAYMEATAGSMIDEINNTSNKYSEVAYDKTRNYRKNYRRAYRR